MTAKSGRRCLCHDFLLEDCENAQAAVAREAQELADARERDARLLRRPGVTAARFAGSCAGCRNGYDEGTPIRSDNTGGWVASCCLDDGGRIT